MTTHSLTKQPVDFSIPLTHTPYETYCQGIFLGLSMTAAALEANYAPTWVRSYGSYLSTNLDIKGRIAYLFKAKTDALIDSSVSTELERRQRLTEIQRGRLSQVIGPDGDLLPEALESGALAEVKTVRYKDGSVGQSVKLHNPVTAIKEHNLMDGVYDQPGGLIDNRRQLFIVTSEKVAERMARMGERTKRAQSEIDVAAAMLEGEDSPQEGKEGA